MNEPIISPWLIYWAGRAADRITPANIKATGEFAGKTVDTLIEKILKASKAVKE